MRDRLLAIGYRLFPTAINYQTSRFPIDPRPDGFMFRPAAPKFTIKTSANR